MVTEGPSGISQKGIKTDWPFDEGLIFGTTRRLGTRSLEPECESLLSHSSGVLL